MAEEQHADTEKKRGDMAIRALVEGYRECGFGEEKILDKLMDKFAYTREEAKEEMAKFGL